MDEIKLSICEMMRKKYGKSKISFAYMYAIYICKIEKGYLHIQ